MNMNSWTKAASRWISSSLPSEQWIRQPRYINDSATSTSFSWSLIRWHGASWLPLLKNWGPKTCEKRNFGQFCATSDFDREYLRTKATYPKSENYRTYSDSSCVWWKKSGELWSTIYREFDVSLDPLTCTTITQVLRLQPRFWSN